MIWYFHLKKKQLYVHINKCILCKYKKKVKNKNAKYLYNVNTGQLL